MLVPAPSFFSMLVYYLQELQKSEMENLYGLHLSPQVQISCVSKLCVGVGVGSYQSWWNRYSPSSIEAKPKFLESPCTLHPDLQAAFLQQMLTSHFCQAGLLQLSCASGPSHVLLPQPRTLTPRLLSGYLHGSAWMPPPQGHCLSLDLIMSKPKSDFLSDSLPFGCILLTVYPFFFWVMYFFLTILYRILTF